MTNKNNTVLYIGVTSFLIKRVFQYKSKFYPNLLSAKYNCNKLVYFKLFDSIVEAIAREKNLKNWKRDWKKELITKYNPEWKELVV
jgi:putative endonuclease